MRSAEEVAREIHLALTEVSMTALARTERVAEIIRARDAEVRAETLAQAERADPAYRAWREPGPDPRYHERMKAQVRSRMPLLGRALDAGAQPWQPSPLQFDDFRNAEDEHELSQLPLDERIRNGL